jgi:hypothetical protein
MLSNRLYTRLRLLRWAIPITLFILVAIYQLAIAPWMLHQFGLYKHLLVELVLYGTGGPLLAFLVLKYLERWLEEKETSDLQARILEKAQQHVVHSHALNDEALQSLYSVSILLDSLEASLPEIPPEAIIALDRTDQVLEDIIRRIRGKLQAPQPEVRRNGKSEPAAIQ